MMIHKGCGGEIEPTPDLEYEINRDDGTIEYVHGLVCTKCKTEIIGDSQIVIPDLEEGDEEE